MSRTFRPLRRRLRVVLLASACALACAPAFAQSGGPSAAAPRMRFDIPAGPLGTTLLRIAEQSGRSISVPPEVVQGVAAPAVRGSLTIEEALEAALRDSTLTLVRTANGTLSVQARPMSAAGAAGQPAAADASTLAPVTVTAPKEAWDVLPPVYAGGQVARGARLGMLGNKDFMETPFNVTSYTSQLIEDQQATSVAAVAGQNDPSVRTSAGQGTIGDGFSIRGFGLESAELSFNGVPGVAPIWRVNPNFLERIEVLKGPNAFLNGSTIWGSVGGAISIVPKRAGDEPVARVTGSYESRSVFTGHVDVGQRFGEDKALGLRVNATYGKGDMAADRLSTDDRQLAVALDYRRGALRLSADLLYQRQLMHGAKWGSPSLAAAVTRVPRAPDAKLNWAQPWEYSEIEERIAVMRADYDFNENLSAYLGVGSSWSDQRYLTSAATLRDMAGTLAQAFRTHLTPYEGWAFDTGLRGHFRTGPVSHAWNLGLTRLDSRNGNAIGTVSALPMASGLYAPARLPAPYAVNWPAGASKVGQRDMQSVALSDTLGFAHDGVQLTLGARHQKVSSRAFSATTGAVTTSYDKNALTPMLGLVVKVAPSVSIYGNYIEGLTQGDTAPASAVNAGEIFAPYKARQKEVGVKFDTGTLGLTASLFDIKRASGMLDPQTNVYSAGATQRNRGLELNAFGEAAPGVRLLGGIAWIDAELERTPGGVSQGNTAPYEPRLRANLGADVGIRAVPGLSLNGRVIYTGRQYLDAANTLEVPAWTRVDVGVRYETRIGSHQAVFRAGIENLFDRSYWQRYLITGAPRTFRLSATVDF